MVSNNTVDTKEEEPGVHKRKSMENTVNNNPDENPSLTSKMSESSSEANFSPQTVVTWMMVSVAVGLLTIYTMVQLISKKLTQEIDNGTKTEGEINQQHKNTTDISSQTDNKQDTTVYGADLKKTNEDGDQSDVNDLLHKNLMNPENNVEILETNGNPVHVGVECRKSHVASIHMGTGFTGNLNISTETSTERGLSSSKTSCSTPNDENFNATENVTNCRSTATLESCNLSHSTPVTVNYLQTKCFSCNAEISKTNETLAHQVKHIIDSNKYHSTADITDPDPQLLNDFTGTKLKDEFPTENKIDSPDNHPPSTVNCVHTTVKSLSCDIPVSTGLPKKESSNWNIPKENSPSSFHSNFGLEDNLNLCQIKDNKVNKSEISLQNVEAENIDLLHITQSKDCTKDRAVTKTVSDSLNFLSDYHTPQDTTDGSIFSKNTHEDEFMFPQDNETENQLNINSSKEEIELETPRSRYLKYIRDDPLLSKSLDSQMEILKKGCKLLQKKPLKSSLRNSGSEGSLQKKFVHFPPDIRNICTVHKYDSFDEIWCDVDDSACKDEKQRTQSFNN